MGKTKTMTVPVSKRALIQRINRKLRADADGDSLANRVHATRGGRARQELGEYYLLHTRQNRILEADVDLEAFGRKVKALEPWEQLERE